MGEFPLKTTKAFERVLEGLEMVAPQSVRFANLAIRVPEHNSARDRVPLIDTSKPKKDH